MSLSNVVGMARSRVRMRQVLQLVADGLPPARIAERLGISTRSVYHLLHKGLKTESLFPGNLTPERVNELRQIQAEVLATSRQKALETQAVIAARLGTPEEKNMDGTAQARLLEAVVRAVELESNLFGTKQPTRILEEQLRIELKRVDGKIRVEFDRDQLKPKWPTPYGDRTDLACLPDRLDAPEHESAPGAGVDTAEGDLE